LSNAYIYERDNPVTNKTLEIETKERTQSNPIPSPLVANQRARMEQRIATMNANIFRESDVSNNLAELSDC
jgi:hypothetical protein